MQHALSGLPRQRPIRRKAPGHRVACQCYGADDDARLGSGANCISATAEPAYALAIRIMTRMATNMVASSVFLLVS